MSTQSAATAMAVPEAVRRLVARLGEEPTVRRVILFGSRARGESTPRSDVDLAIEAPDASARDWQGFLDLAEDADTLLSIDLVRFEEAPAELRQRILLEGRTLHGQ